MSSSCENACRRPEAKIGGMSVRTVVSWLPDNIIPFPRRHRGDPEPRRVALVTIGFRWCEDAWRRGRVVLSDAEIDAMAAPVWERCLRRWTRRRPRARG
jgi:hypothetical protein